MVAGRTRYEVRNISAVSPKFQPALSTRTLASPTAGVLRKRCSTHRMVGSIGRWKSHDVNPSARKLRERIIVRVGRPMSLSALIVSFVMSTGKTWKRASEPSVSGFDVYSAFLRFCSLNCSLSRMRMPFACRSPMLTFSAAGFIATSTSGASPGVNTSRLEKWSWNPLTPASVPAGARISAGKSGSVLRSLPANAVSLVKCMPASCMPSPESPAKRMTTSSRSSTAFNAPAPAAVALSGSMLGLRSLHPQPHPPVRRLAPPLPEIYRRHGANSTERLGRRRRRREVMAWIEAAAGHVVGMPAAKRAPPLGVWRCGRLIRQRARCLPPTNRVAPHRAWHTLCGQTRSRQAAARTQRPNAKRETRRANGAPLRAPLLRRPLRHDRGHREIRRGAVVSLMQGDLDRQLALELAQCGGLVLMEKAGDGGMQVDDHLLHRCVHQRFAADPPQHLVGDAGDAF